MKIIIIFVWLLTIGPCFSQEQFKILDQGEEALQARIDSIDNAQDEVILCYFTFSQDLVSNSLFARLIAAVDRGVKVRLIVDGYYHEISKKMFSYLTSKGIEIKIYAPFNLLRPNRWWKRMHNKFFVVDQKIFISGGRNIKDNYFDFAEYNYHDRDIIVASSKLATQVKNYFEILWQQKFVVNAKSKELKNVEYLAQENEIVQAATEIQARSNISFNRNIHWVTEVDKLDNFEFIFDPIKKDKNEGTGERLYQLLANAKQSIKIETPYFVMTNKAMKMFKELSSKGVKIRILTNSLYSTDVLLSQGSYRNKKKKLLKMGIELQEINEKNIRLHAKSYLIDDEISVIGSFNFNGRSLYQDFEVLTVSTNAEVAQELSESMEDSLNMAYMLDPSLPMRQMHIMNDHVSLDKKIRAFITRIFLAPILKVQI